MNCQFCGKAIKQEVTGRQKRYCSEAHKQAAFRKRHPEKLLQNELRAARRRIAELEHFAKKHVPGYRLAKDIVPCELWGFISLHGGIAREPVYRLIDMNMLKPIAGEENTLLLDAEGQSTIYQCFHEDRHWRNCKDCPHGIIP